MTNISVTSSSSITYDHAFPIEPLLAKIAQASKDKRVTETINNCHIEIKECPSIAQCDLSNRVIVLDPSLFEDEKQGQPQALASLAFELINLSQEKQFRSLQNRAKELTADQFVEEYEGIEYASALETRRIVREILSPKDWESAPLAFTTNHFKDHYLLQQMKGHSQQIFERNASLLAPNSSYHGDWVDPLNEKEIEYLCAYFDLKARSEDPLPSVNKKAKQDLEFLKEYICNESKKGSDFFQRLEQRLLKLETVSGRNSPPPLPVEITPPHPSFTSLALAIDSKANSPFLSL